VKVLVINVGSTSLKYDFYEMDTEASLARGNLERDHRPLTDVMRDVLAALPAAPDAVGHRVVHGGERLVHPVRIDAAVEAVIEECAVFAPLHNPVNLLGIRAAREVFPDLPHVAVFDTAFHAAMPERSFAYGLPYELYLERGIRRYGFHGPSHQYMAACAAEHLKTDPSRLRLITCHLGGGASVAAIEGGTSIDTSMGMTPLEGLLMGTRSGDLDPAVPLLLVRDGQIPAEIDELLNRRSGIAGLSGISGDVRVLQASDDPHAAEALDLFAYRTSQAIASHAVALGGLDALVFTAGIGEHADSVRAAICRRLAWLGLELDEAANHRHGPCISHPHSRVSAWVIPTNEEYVIARHAWALTAGEPLT